MDTTPDPDEKHLATLRAKIDEIDRRLVEVLSERAQVVVAIGEAKQDHKTPIYAPHREAQVLERVLASNPGPLPDRTVEAIYRELMSGSFALELPLRVGYLGPPGSISHIAAVRHFGSSIECADLGTIENVLEEVAAERCHYGLVPYENSTGGSITETLDALVEHDVTIYAEQLIEVRHAFLANCAPSDVNTIHSKREVFSQCRKWIMRNYPEAELVSEGSSAAAVRHAETAEGAAAIGSTLAGELYRVNVLYDAIQDRPDNITRFLIVAREAAQPTGDDKTTVLFVTADKPGALVDVLTVFRDADINLSHIDKRPSGRSSWEYTFFVDCVGHQSDPRMIQALKEARTHCVSLKVLGSYPRAKSVL